MADIQDIQDADVDMVSGELTEHFKTRYCLKDCKSVGLEDVYVLHLSVNPEGKILSGLSNQTVCIHDIALNKIKTETVDNPIIGAKFSPLHPNLFYIGTKESVQLWDSRTFAKEVTFDLQNLDKDKRPKPFLSFDMNCEDKYLSAGTEVLNHDAFVVFWDIRGTKNILGGYWETLGDDVTVNQFSKQDANQLMSASADGQVNLFDISQECEDEALVTSLNTEAPIRSLTYLQDDKVAIVLDHEEAILWKTYEGQPYRSFSREDFTVAIRRKITPWTYVCDIHHDLENNKTFVLSGSSYEPSPCLRILNVSKTKLKPMADLKSKHSNNVITRSSVLFKNGIFVTGSEDGLINVWTPGEEEEVIEAATEALGKKPKKDKKPYQRPK